ncbi:peptidoglycan hydrolase CwlO-like protein [Flavobacterium arsenatis]|uniref:Peptidoglycan hydrolase CwlO-like protein n=1 Tax=Flavobacterium arsenatis TaxID=1484332 RepID=A0ABU1TJJ5_9FLAO|nr:hypothetical protein [Flavobacterium arsenatis]MDR6966150.1 peptidoglycan hydrolase CwlO-like protein [Flavobacterium arsenatis]
MKIKIVSFIILFTLFISNAANAQYRNNRNGLDRSMMSGQGNPTPKKQKPIDQVQATTDKLTSELGLDGFQSAIVKTIVDDYKNASTSIMEEQVPNELKYEKLTVANNNMEAKILEILNDKQKVKFAALKDKAQNKDKKDKKKKKGKKDKEEAAEPVEE